MTEDKPIRQDALVYWKKHLSDGLLAIADNARKQFATNAYSWLISLSEIRDCGFVIPEKCLSGGDINRDDYDTVIYDLQMMVALLETDEQWNAAGGYGPNREDGRQHFKHSEHMVAGVARTSGRRS